MRDPDAGDERWDPIASVPTPQAALRGCSECLDVVRTILEIPYSQDLQAGLVRIQVRDALEDCLILWEDADGKLRWTEGVFEQRPPSLEIPDD